MSTPENLSPDEERHINNQIKSALFDAETGSQSYTSPGAPPEVVDSFYQSIREIEERADEPPVSVRSLLPAVDLPRPDTLTEEAAAQAAVDRLLHLLAEADVYIDDHPFHLTAREYYAWLCGTFLQEEIHFPYGNGWQVHCTYAETEPESPPNMFLSLSMFLGQLLRTDGHPEHFLLKGATYQDMEAQAPPRQAHYLRCWRAGFRELEMTELVPRRAVDHVGNAAQFEFDVTYRGKLENGKPFEYSGRGHASMYYSDPYWEIAALRFPGFTLAEE